MADALAKKILVIGWDAADWKVINPLLEKGWMTNLQKLMNEGVHGNIATLYPVLSPMLWTSIATGKRPYKHGIHGFSEPDPHSGGIRPITNLSRKTKAVWNILNQMGKKCNVIGWWPSHPAEPIDGLMVSNHFQRATAPLGKPWPMQPGTTNRVDLIEPLKELRLHPAELDESHILPFIPGAAKIDQQKDKRLESLAKIIADCTSIHAAATAAIQLEEWDFMAVYYDAIDHFCHAFMKYHPPRQKHIPEDDFEMYKDVVVGGYRFHDMMLGVLLALAGEETTVILMSDHGFHPDHLRPRSLPLEPAGPAAEHRHYGIFVMKGPHVRKGEQVFGASVLDLCPTVLNAFGLPVGEDMDGKPLVSAYTETPEVKSLPSWDNVEGPKPDGRHPSDKVMDPIEAKEAIQQLVALGYIEKPDENREVAVAETVRELHYNLARSYMDGGLHADAVPLLETIWEKWREEHRFGVQLINCYLALGQTQKAAETLDLTLLHKQRSAEEARKQLQEFQEENKDKKAEDFTEKQKRNLRKWQSQAAFNPFAMAYLRASILHAEGDDAQALAALKAAEKADPSQPGLHLKIGEIYLSMKRWKEAERSFLKVLDIDRENASAYVGLARAFMPQRRNLEAASVALTAVDLIYHNPRAHYLLGVALHRCGRVKAATDAIRVALAQNPNFPEAHKRLAFIYEKRLNQPALAERHKKAAAEARKRINELKNRKTVNQPHMEIPTTSQSRKPDFHSTEGAAPGDASEAITIVSGLPRTGTSLMMQMLEAGGIQPVTDRKRLADEDNPKGYYEFEKAKNLSKDSSWLPEAKGRAVKLVAQLLPFLPGGPSIKQGEAKKEGFIPPSPYLYRVIFMDRDLDEVLASQKTMLDRNAREGAKLAPEKLKGVFIQQLERVAQLLQIRQIPTLYIQHSECIRNPASVAAKVNHFYGGILDEAAMASVVDPSLYRQKVG